MPRGFLLKETYTVESSQSNASELQFDCFFLQEVPRSVRTLYYSVLCTGLGELLLLRALFHQGVILIWYM